MGMVAFVVVYVAAALLLVPGAALTLAAGLLYGPLLGTAIVSPASVIAATLAFIIGRTAGRGWIAGRIARYPKFNALDAAIGRSGLRLVALVRLSPAVPFSLLNYALGLTTIRLRDYVLGSFVGMLPGTFLYVYLGSLGSTIGTVAQPSNGGSTLQRAVYWLGLVASIAAVFLITRIARRALAQELDEPKA
jgi:uncharacterized membrane protein YdjX (TVP38/TMEM64 family)